MHFITKMNKEYPIIYLSKLSRKHNEDKDSSNKHSITVIYIPVMLPNTFRQLTVNVDES
eukprot:bmy_19058T0